MWISIATPMVVEVGRRVGRPSHDRKGPHVKLKLLVAVAMFAIGFGAVGYVLLAPSSAGAATTTYLTSTASTTDVTQEAVATGSVAASTSYGLGFGRSPAAIASGATSSGGTTDLSWTVDSVAVTVGDRVAAGDVLATATSSDAQAELVSAQADLATAQQQLADDTAKPTDDDVAAADSALTKAEMSLEQAQRSYTETRRSNSMALLQSETSVTDAETQYEDDQDDGAVSSILQQDRRTLRDAKRNLTTTKRNNASSLANAKESVESAKLALADAQRDHATALAPATEATLAADRAAVENAQHALDAAQSAADAATITAPADGLVTSVDLVVGAAAPSGDAITMEAGPMLVTADFTETDLLSLATGQPASVTVDAIDGELTGTLSSIDPVASSSGASSVVSYPATITLTDAPDTIRTGMSADVSVVTASQEGVVAVPVASLVGRGGSYMVRTLASDGTEQLVPVEVGLVTDTLAAVTSGITDGTTVITGTASQQANGSTSQGGLGGLGGFGGLGGGGAFPGGFPGGGRQRGGNCWASRCSRPGPRGSRRPIPAPPRSWATCSSTSATCGGSTTSAPSRCRRSGASASRSARASSWPSSGPRARASRRS
jgi:multidrug efflux pump subunit AcrA (membrane-fusion protein)